MIFQGMPYILEYLRAEEQRERRLGVKDTRLQVRLQPCSEEKHVLIS